MEDITVFYDPIYVALLWPLPFAIVLGGILSAMFAKSATPLKIAAILAGLSVVLDKTAEAYLLGELALKDFGDNEYVAAGIADVFHMQAIANGFLAAVLFLVCILIAAYRNWRHQRLAQVGQSFLHD